MMLSMFVQHSILFTSAVQPLWLFALCLGLLLQMHLIAPNIEPKCCSLCYAGAISLVWKHAEDYIVLQGWTHTPSASTSGCQRKCQLTQCYTELPPHGRPDKYQQSIENCWTTRAFLCFCQVEQVQLFGNTFLHFRVCSLIAFLRLLC